jgi:hypothetical protein
MTGTDALTASFAVLAAGAGAWMGSRERRPLTTGPVTITIRPGWAGQVATWAATMCWLVAAYLGLAAVVHGATAGQVTAGPAAWGGPPWWPVAVGTAVLTALCALGFALGAFFPGRFTAPAATLGAFLLVLLGAVYTLLTSTRLPPVGAGVSDLSIVQVMFLAGITVMALGAVGLRAIPAGLTLRRAAAIITLAGLATAGTAVGLAGTARPAARGVVIPALHDASTARPVPALWAT